MAGPILLATGNKHKIIEMRAILSGLLPASIELLSLTDIGLESPPDSLERFSTFTANSRAKALWCRDRSGLTSIADDSGICVDALGGAPGIYSARWAGTGASSAQCNARLLAELARVGASSPEQRRASYVCSATVARPSSPSAGSRRRADVFSAHGTMWGMILPPDQISEANGGFGYDPLFFAAELGVVLSEARAEEKNRTSHRAHALRLLASELLRLL